MRGTSTFADCDGRDVDVTELTPPDGVFPVVSTTAPRCRSTSAPTTGTSGDDG